MSIPFDATLEQRADYLRGSGVWAALSEPALHAVAGAMQPARHPNGEFIIRHGEPGRHLHVLTKGQAEVHVHTGRGAAVTVSTMVEGACFGEMSLLSGDLTSADVVAASDCETLMLDRASFEALVASEPQLLREFVRMVSARLKDSNVATGAARDKERGLTRFLQEANADEFADLVGSVPALRKLQQRVDALAQIDGPILIQGERGTGKELIARLVHFRSARKDAPLLCTDCAQIAETPWGDKLFGDYRPGPDDEGPPAAVCYMDLARGGTIVLKNVDALPRAIQERLAAFLAGDGPSAAGPPGSVRIIATCRGHLGDLASAGRVSPALATAMAANAVAVPPLRDRKRDIPDLARYFVRKHAKRIGRPVPTLDDQSLRKLVTHDYLHANVVELEEAIQRAVILTDGERLEAEAVFLGQPPSPSRWALNLLALPRPLVRRALWLFPRAAQAVAAVGFAFVLYGAFLASAGAAGRWALFMVWSAGWPLLVLSFFFTGRAWCAICPMLTAASATRRIVNLKWQIPAWLRRNDASILMAGFAGIIWAEQVTGMRDSARATGVLLLCIMAGAVGTAVLLPRRTWCRYLCPLGGFASVCSMTGVIELRPTWDICSAKCRDHSCFKGDARAEGCPMFNHVMFVDSNEHCVLCLNCVHTCPNDSPQLNLRLPARDLAGTASEPSKAGRLTALFAGLLPALLLVLNLERDGAGAWAQMLHEHRFLWITALLSLGALLPQLGLWLLSRRLDASSDSAAGTRFWGRLTAWVPVVAAGFACYELAYVPWLDSARVTLGTPSPDGAARALSFALLSLVQGVIMWSGLVVTLVVLWNLRRKEADVERRLPRRAEIAGLGTGAAYWALLALLMLS